jgi:hypothetical protein
MQFKIEAHDLERIATGFRLISKEISYGCLANVLLSVATENSGAVRGTMLLSDRGKLLAKAKSMLSSRRLLLSKREHETHWREARDEPRFINAENRSRPGPAPTRDPRSRAQRRGRHCLRRWKDPHAESVNARDGQASGAFRYKCGIEPPSCIGSRRSKRRRKRTFVWDCRSAEKSVSLTESVNDWRRTQRKWRH